eukprot:gene11275-38866_t
MLADHMKQKVAVSDMFGDRMHNLDLHFSMGIETVATYDPASQEFVIHSPTLTSMKWWPTGMYTMTHGLVFARLVAGGVDRGFHGFLVQFRDAEGCLLPGVEVGEIGPKLNAHHANIGFARFDHVRGESKLRYFSMIVARAYLVHGASAATIAAKAGNAAAIDELRRWCFGGMKAWGTTWAHAAVEDLRKSCGGQGYLMSSGIAGLSAAYTEYVTVEGDPVVLSKQG